MSSEMTALLSGADEHSEYYCPITCELMEDPVVCADGTSYERSAIEKWLNIHSTSPLTGAVLPHKNLIPNLSLRALVNEYRTARSVAPLRRTGISAGVQPPSPAQAPLPVLRDELAAEGLPAVLEMSPAEARRHLCNHVGSGWTTNTNAANYCDIQSCITVGTIVTKIESFVETRTRVSRTKPYLQGAFLSRADGVAPDVWDMQCTEQPLFQHKEEEIEIPYTSSIDVCSVCRGVGRAECASCHGSARTACSSCRGPGRASRGASHCQRCSGSGQVECSNKSCDRGQAKCSGCAGSGEVRRYDVLLRKHFTTTSGRNTGTAISDRDLSSSTICNAPGIVIYTDEGVRVTCPRGFSGEVNRNLAAVGSAAEEAAEKVCRKGGRVIRQRLTVQQVPITIAKADYQGQHFHWYVYGSGYTVTAYGYPNNCCECCNRCTIS